MEPNWTCVTHTTIGYLEGTSKPNHLIHRIMSHHGGLKTHMQKAILGEYILIAIGKVWGPKPDLMVFLYKQIILPGLLYACFAWAHVINIADMK